MGLQGLGPGASAWVWARWHGEPPREGVAEDAPAQPSPFLGDLPPPSSRPPPLLGPPKGMGEGSRAPLPPPQGFILLRGREEGICKLKLEPLSPQGTLEAGRECSVPVRMEGAWGRCRHRLRGPGTCGSFCSLRAHSWAAGGRSAAGTLEGTHQAPWPGRSSKVRSMEPLLPFPQQSGARFQPRQLCLVTALKLLPLLCTGPGFKSHPCHFLCGLGPVTYFYLPKCGFPVA